MKNGKVKGIVLTLVGGIFWGVGGSCGQYLFENKEVNSGLLVPIRLFAAGLLILVLQLIRKEKIFDIWKEKRDAAETLLFALFGMMLCQYSYFTTIQYSNAGTATVLQYTGPAMILVYLCVKAKRWPKAYEIAALIFSCGGVFVLATHGDLSSLALPPEALFWGIVAAVTLVVYNLQPIRIIAKFSTLTVMGWGMTIGGIVLTAVMRPWKVSAVWDGETAAALSFIVLFGTIAAFYCYLTGVRLVGAANASLLACIEPIAATIVAAAWLKVRFTPIDLVGFALTITAVVIISVYQIKAERKNT
ncbi:MAG: EamA family transporter [Clostridia bacterium]|nr:EamA family transporter [Clostridia bacterium]